MSAATPSRSEALRRLAEERFDMLIIGGGATGTGTALDAASRGLKVALVERSDLSEGTSSRSTKLVHGGVRYLEQAVKHADRSQFSLVREALRERALLLRNAPHLARALPLLTPIYGALELPYYFTGLKLYDMLAGKANLAPSRLIGKPDAEKRFPMLRREGLRGAVEYHDGQFDDARMNVALALTAAEHGAVIANHVEVTDLIKRSGRLTGAVVKDHSDAGTARIEIDAKVVVNATGPFADAVRRMDDPDVPQMLTTSSGVHVVLPGRFSPPDTGLLIPKTEDGRVLFLLP
ncbi:MAG TPA: FAD-dependent oxidoreductase, partial [Trueperaceae bacterium]|nr:FAD-dependent oxidoreductase [Trueperaceae bacterium]